MPTRSKVRSPAADILDGAREGADPPPNLPAVGLQLRLTRAARSDPAAQPRQRRAGPHEPGQEIFQLRQLNLELTLTGARTAGKDVENELCAVDDFPVQRPLQIPELRRTQLVVDDDHIHFRFVTGPRQQLNLALAQEERRIRPLSILQHAQDDRGARCGREAGQLVKRRLNIQPAVWTASQADNRSTFSRRCEGRRN